MAVPVRSDLLAQVLDDERRLVAGMSRLLDERRNHVEGLSRGLPRPAELLEGAMQALDYATDRVDSLVARQMERSAARLATAAASLPHPREVIARAESDLANKNARIAAALTGFVRERSNGFASLSAGERMAGGMRRRIADGEARLKANEQLLNSLSYERVLDRGFALIRDEDGEPVMQAAETTAGQTVSIHFSDNAVAATIGGSADGAKKSPPRKPAERKATAKKPAKPRKSAPAPGGDQGSLF